MTEVAEKAKPKSARILSPDQQRFNLAEVLRQDWVVNAEAGTTIDEALDTQYWSHVAVHLQPLDTIEVREETGEWILKLRVINTGRNWAQMFEEQRFELTTRAERMVSVERYRIEYKGAVRLHCVIRNNDNEIVQQGMRTKAEAIAWLESHERAVST